MFSTTKTTKKYLWTSFGVVRRAVVQNFRVFSWNFRGMRNSGARGFGLELNRSLVIIAAAAKPQGVDPMTVKLFAYLSGT